MGSDVAVRVRAREVLLEGVLREIDRGILSVIRERSEGLVGTANRSGSRLKLLAKEVRHERPVKSASFRKGVVLAQPVPGILSKTRALDMVQDLKNGAARKDSPLLCYGVPVMNVCHLRDHWRLAQQ